MTLQPRHARAIIGVVLMALGVAAYALVLFHVGAPPEGCTATWVQLIRQYGFPACLVIGGYNLFQRDALAQIAAAWRGRGP